MVLYRGGGGGLFFVVGFDGGGGGGVWTWIVEQDELMNI